MVEWTFLSITLERTSVIIIFIGLLYGKHNCYFVSDVWLCQCVDKMQQHWLDSQCSFHLGFSIYNDLHMSPTFHFRLLATVTEKSISFPQQTAECEIQDSYASHCK